MRKYIIPAAAALICVVFTAFTPVIQKTINTTEKSGDEIKWMTWDEAVAQNKIKPKKIMVDVYTNWCGWCKVMDRETFTKPEIIRYVNDNYYAVKLNAEQREDIIFDGKTFSFVKSGNGGYHSFAATLLDNNMGYPTLVYLTERFERVVISPGFKKPDQLMKELKFTGENAYAKMSWDQYMEGNK